MSYQNIFKNWASKIIPSCALRYRFKCRNNFTCVPEENEHQCEAFVASLRPMINPKRPAFMVSVVSIPMVSYRISAWWSWHYGMHDRQRWDEWHRDRLGSPFEDPPTYGSPCQALSHSKNKSCTSHVVQICASRGWNSTFIFADVDGHSVSERKSGLLTNLQVASQQRGLPNAIN